MGTSWVVGSVVRSLSFNAGSVNSIPGQAVGILHALWPKTNKQTKKTVEQKQCYDTFNRDFKK